VSLWDRFRRGLSRTRDALTQAVGAALGKRTLDPATVEQLEHALLGADVGPATTERLIAEARKALDKDATLDLRAALERGAASLVGSKQAAFAPGTEKPWVALLVGVNGVGKTTFAGKLAASYARAGKKTLLVAADTFRAAAAEQLTTWGERVGVPAVRGPEGSDPASVAFEAVKTGIEQEADVVLVDTTGRLQNKAGLMDELGKVKRVVEKQAAVSEVLLVLDATTGQNGLQQARVFREVVDVTGIVLTKLDGSAKGGIVVAVQRELGVPVKLVGLGEGADDLAPFDPEQFVDALLGETA
jgi:fused signal recognition particle receptor